MTTVPLPEPYFPRARKQRRDGAYEVHPAYTADQMRDYAAQCVAAARAQPAAEPVAVPLPELPTEALYRAKWEHIHRVLAACSGNLSEAARRLRIDRRTLQRKLQKRPPRK